MKKLIMFMFAAVAAMVSQAAYIDWSVNKQSFYWDDATSAAKTYAAGKMEYLLVFDSTDDADDLWSSIKAGDTTIASVVDSKSPYLVTSATGGTGTKKGQISVTKFSSDKVSTDTQYYAVFVYDGSNFLMSDAIAGKGYTEEGTPVSFMANQFTDASGTNYGVKNTRTGWTSVEESIPEPTSGLLMLVGASLLALRRRRA